MSVGSIAPVGALRLPRALFAPWCRQVAVVQAVSVLAWLVYFAVWAQNALSPSAAAKAVWWCMSGMSLAAANGSGPTGPVGSLPMWLSMWLLMAAAMTLPALLPATQHLAINTFRRRRPIAVATFVTIHLLVWLAFGVAASTALDLLHGAPADTVFAMALALAAAYEMTPAKHRALNRCHRSSPLPPRGLRGLLGTGRFAWINASGCVASCWLAMLTMLLAPVAQPAAMAGMTVAMSYERLTRRPRKGRQRVAMGYTALAVAFTLAPL